MAYVTKSISKVVQDIYAGNVFLPAIQRKYVWTPNQITRLMDSIMCGYPFGTFLFWRVKYRVANEKCYSMYEFIRDYDERKRYNEQTIRPFPVSQEDPDRSFVAVLDGQQRLTSLYIALMGSMTIRRYRARIDNVDAYQKKELYFDLHSQVQNNDYDNSDVTFLFDFLTADEAQQDNTHFWFKVTDILRFPDLEALNDYIYNEGFAQDKVAIRNLTRLFARVQTDELINYYELDKDSMDEILDIFVRVNSAGTVLSKTDLLFSTIVAAWDQGRAKFDDLLKNINAEGNHFKFTNDFLLSAFLYVEDLPTSLKVESFSGDNVKKIQEHWDDIVAAISDTVKLLVDFGFSSENIIAYNAILPVIYYRYNRGSDVFNSKQVKNEWRKYLVVAQLNHIFGRSSNSVLSVIRNELKKRLGEGNDFSLSWLQSIVFTGNTTLKCTKDEIGDWFDKFEKGAETFMVLSLLYPIDVRYKFDQDHMHPYSSFESAKLPTQTREELKALQHKRNNLANLQILSDSENRSKNDQALQDWLKKDDNEKKVKYLPEGVSYELKDCEAFWKARRELMIKELVKILCPDEDISDQHDTIPEEEAATLE